MKMFEWCTCWALFLSIFLFLAKKKTHQKTQKNKKTPPEYCCHLGDEGKVSMCLINLYFAHVLIACSPECLLHWKSQVESTFTL